MRIDFKLPFALAFAFGATILAAQGANAADLGTSCVCTENLAGSPVSGRIADVSGSVTSVGSSGSVAAKTGAPVSLGSRIITGPDGRLSMRVGRQCVVSVQENSTVDILNNGGQMCVRVAGTGAPGAAGLPSVAPLGLGGLSGLGGAALPLTIGAVGLGVAGWTLSTQNDDKGVSN